MKRSAWRGALIAGTALVSACATSLYEGKYDWYAGWREASVVAIGPASSFRRGPSCPAPSDLALYAEVVYRHLRSRDYRVVPVPDSSFKPGDLVYVNVEDCSASLEHGR